MNENHYDDHDTQPIRLPRERRSSFQDTPAEESRWSGSRPEIKTSLFSPINPNEPDSLKGYESLAIGDVLQVPVAIHDESYTGKQAELSHEEFVMKGLGYSEGRYVADLVTGAGLEETISANLVSDGSLLEARIAESLLRRDGLDVRSAGAVAYEEDPLNPDRDKA